MDMVEMLTRRYKRERAAREQAEALIELKSRELYTAKMAAEYANRAKTEFLANISHGLRTPLNAIIGFSEVLQASLDREGINGLPTAPDPSQKDYVVHILQAGRNLYDIIEQIIEVSKIKIDGRSLVLSRFDLRKTIAMCLDLCRPRAVAAKIALDFENSDDIGTIEADRQAIKQVLLNVLGNAIKFTPEGGTVRVRANQDEASRIRIVVTDSGIGIGPEHLTKVTQPFYQVDGGLNRRHEGVGLGLAIVQSLVDLHTGTLQISSQPNQGTEVTITLPCQQTHAPGLEIAPPVAVNG